MNASRSRSSGAAGYDAFDHLVTMVAVLDHDGRCHYVNAAFESTLGLPRRALQRGRMFDWFVDPATLKVTFDAVVANEFSTARLEALLRRPPGAASADPLPVHAIVTQIDHGEQVLLELVEIEQQTRQDREHDQQPLPPGSGPGCRFTRVRLRFIESGDETVGIRVALVGLTLQGPQDNRVKGR